MQLAEDYLTAVNQGKKLTVRLLYFDRVSLACDPVFLLLKRTETRTLAGQMEPPGGKLGIDESAETGMIREMFEETGIALTKKELVFAFYLDFFHQEEFAIREFFFIAVGANMPILVNTKEHCSFAWATLNQLNQYPLHPTILSFLQEKIPWIRQFLTKH